MSSASQQFNATSGASYEHTDYNGEIGNIITHINNIYALIDDSTGTAPLTVDGTNNRLGINITSPLSELHVADAAGSVEGRFDSTITGTTYGLYMGADANEPYIGSRTNHGLRVVTNSLLTAYFETTKKMRLYSEGSVTDYAHIYSSSANDLVLSPYANGDVVTIGRMPRRIFSSTTYVESHIQSGSVFKNGTGTSILTGTVTFPVAFSAGTIRVTTGSAGSLNGSDPTDETSFNAGTGFLGIDIYDKTASGFSWLMYNNYVGGSIPSGLRVGFDWIAIGPV